MRVYQAKVRGRIMFSNILKQLQIHGLDSRPHLLPLALSAVLHFKQRRLYQSQMRQLHQEILANGKYGVYRVSLIRIVKN